MDKKHAIKWFKEIQGGDGVVRSKFPDNLKGNLAAHLWNEITFTYGIEYGVLIALMDIFDITIEDLRT